MTVQLETVVKNNDYEYLLGHGIPDHVVQHRVDALMQQIDHPDYFMIKVCGVKVLCREIDDALIVSLMISDNGNASKAFTELHKIYGKRLLTQYSMRWISSRSKFPQTVVADGDLYFDCTPKAKRGPLKYPYGYNYSQTITWGLQLRGELYE